LVIIIFNKLSLCESIGPANGKIIQTVENMNPDYIPMFLYSCMQINIELNEYAFFVPLFRASAQDLTDMSIDDEQYEYKRMIKEQKDLIKSTIEKMKLKNRVFSSLPKSYINNFNYEIEKITKPNDNIHYNDFYKALSIASYGVIIFFKNRMNLII